MTRRIALLTGDNDAPGMNAVIRAVTRAALYHNWEMMGICDGFTGLLAGEFIPLTARTVDASLHWGGTFLGSLNDAPVLTEGERKLALNRLAEAQIDALVVIGGLDAQEKAYSLSQRKFPVIGIAVSVENDLAGFDLCTGVDTALAVAVENIERLKTTRKSMTFIVEVAGHRSGYLALVAGIASGADVIVVPEIEITPEHIAAVIKAVPEAGKRHHIILVAEGAFYTANWLRRYLAEDESQVGRLQVEHLAHIQRKASPSACDSMLGTYIGVAAVQALAREEYGVVLGSTRGEIRSLPFDQVVGKINPLDPELLKLIDIFSISKCAEVPAV